MPDMLVIIAILLSKCTFTLCYNTDNWESRDGVVRERTPPTNMAWVQLPVPVSYVG